MPPPPRTCMEQRRSFVPIHTLSDPIRVPIGH
jgi:hypothetical protein